MRSVGEMWRNRYHPHISTSLCTCVFAPEVSTCIWARVCVLQSLATINKLIAMEKWLIKVLKMGRNHNYHGILYIKAYISFISTAVQTVCFCPKFGSFYLSFTTIYWLLREKRTISAHFYRYFKTIVI